MSKYHYRTTDLNSIRGAPKIYTRREQALEGVDTQDRYMTRGRVHAEVANLLDRAITVDSK
jgi:hypothetical protein